MPSRRKKSVYIHEVRKAIAADGAVKTYSRDEVSALFNVSSIPELAMVQLWALDTRYRCPTLEVWDKFLSWSDVDEKRYKSQFYDCDNFAISLQAESARRFDLNSCGVIYDFSGAHAYNIILVHDKNNGLGFRIIEPQNDRLIITTGRGMYKLSRATAILS